MELHNHAIYDEKIMTQMVCFQLFHVPRRWKLPGLLWWFLMIVGLSFVVAVQSHADFIPSFVFMLVLLLAIMGILILYMIMKVRKRAKEDPSVSHFVFYDDRLESSLANRDAKSEGACFYQNLFQAYETKTCFYLYINKMQAFLIVKEGFSDENDVIALREKLVSVLGKKYKNCM